MEVLGGAAVSCERGTPVQLQQRLQLQWQEASANRHSGFAERAMCVDEGVHSWRGGAISYEQGTPVNTPPTRAVSVLGVVLLACRVAGLRGNRYPPASQRHNRRESLLNLLRRTVH